MKKILSLLTLSLTLNVTGNAQKSEKPGSAVEKKSSFESQATTTILNREHLRIIETSADAQLHVLGQAIIGELSQPTGKDSNYKLAVDGKIVAKEVVVRIDNWADYVFTNNYHLMPLKDVKNYLKTHRHLPGINTAHELEENGLNLGEMQRKQMEKTEDLYLYVIQLSEQMEQLKLENAALKKEMQEQKK